MMNLEADARWRAAQRLELNFWRTWQTGPLWQNLDIPAYWREEVANFGETLDCFRGLRVLDVGCGPYGLIHYANEAAERIRVDPLLPQYTSRSPLEGRQLSLCAMAESLPLADRSVDLAVCFNALDHMLDPEAALDEIARVLRPGGTALLMIHTFPSWLRPAFPLDRMHPHHFTAETFVSLAGSRLRIDRCRTVRRRFDTSGGKWWMPSMWKYFAAGLFVSITYLRATALPAILPAC